MSDRLAVMNAGRIEQVGTPAEVYEEPWTPFVAGFVGTSNMLTDAAAEAVAGSPAPLTIRPEKIRMLPADEAASPGDCTVTGRVEAVVYLGAVTRYRVRLDVGGQELIVLQQNLHQSSMQALEVQGAAVRLAWSPENNRFLHDEEPRGDER